MVRKERGMCLYGSEKWEFLETAGKRRTCKGKRKYVRCWTPGKKDKDEERVAHNVDGFIYMKENICPVDKAKVEGWKEILSVPSPKERKWQRGAQRSLLTTLVLPKEPGGFKRMWVSNIPKVLLWIIQSWESSMISTHHWAWVSSSGPTQVQGKAITLRVFPASWPIRHLRDRGGWITRAFHRGTRHWFTFHDGPF